MEEDKNKPVTFMRTAGHSPVMFTVLILYQLFHK